jgi:uncharacterized protein YecT (DUF1311 family)
MDDDVAYLAGWLKVSLALIGAIFLILVSARSVGAEGTPQSTVPGTYNRSCEQTALTQVAMGECAQSELKQVQGQLTTLLKEESARFGSKAVNKLQSQWRRFRDSECSLEALPNKGGTVVGLIMEIVRLS